MKVKIVFAIILVLIATNSFALSKRQLLGIILSSNGAANMQSDEHPIVWETDNSTIVVNYIEEMGVVICFKKHNTSLTQNDYSNVNFNSPLNLTEFEGEKFVSYKFVIFDEDDIEYIQKHLFAAAVLLDYFDK